VKNAVIGSAKCRRYTACFLLSDVATSPRVKLAVTFDAA